MAGGACGSQCIHSQEAEGGEYLCLGCFLLFVFKNDVYVCAVCTRGGLHAYLRVGTCIRVGAQASVCTHVDVRLLLHVFLDAPLI